MVHPKVRGNFAFPGITDFVAAEVAAMGLPAAEAAVVTDGARRSPHLQAVSTTISNAANTHDPRDVPAILALGEGQVRAMEAEARAARAAYAFAFHAAGADPAAWLADRRPAPAETQARAEAPTQNRPAPKSR